MSRFAGLKKNAAPEAPVKPSINDEVATSPSAQSSPLPQPARKTRGKAKRPLSAIFRRKFPGGFICWRSIMKQASRACSAKRSMI